MQRTSGTGERANEEVFQRKSRLLAMEVVQYFKYGKELIAFKHSENNWAEGLIVKIRFVLGAPSKLKIEISRGNISSKNEIDDEAWWKELELMSKLFSEEELKFIQGVIGG